MNRCYIVLMLNSFVVLHDGIIIVSVVFEILSIYFNVDSLLIFYHDLKQKFFILYLCNVPCTKESEEVADKDINQDTYYTLDSGMKFIIWPWQHNLTSFTYNRGTTVWLPFYFCISPCFFIIRYFQICFYFSIIYHYYLLKVSNLFHVPCNHRFPNSRPCLHKWHFLNCIKKSGLLYYILFKLLFTSY